MRTYTNRHCLNTLVPEAVNKIYSINTTSGTPDISVFPGTINYIGLAIQHP